MKYIIMTAVLAIMSVGTAYAATPAAAFGDWETDNHSAIIRVVPCGEKLCGTVLRLLDPNAPSHDTNNPDPAKRSHPMIGTTILNSYSRAGQGWDNGTVYDPKAGRAYKSRVIVGPSGTLDVTGCIAFLCKTKHWTRVP